MFGCTKTAYTIPPPKAINDIAITKNGIFLLATKKSIISNKKVIVPTILEIHSHHG